MIQQSKSYSVFFLLPPFVPFLSRFPFDTVFLSMNENTYIINQLRILLWSFLTDFVQWNLLVDKLCGLLNIHNHYHHPNRASTYIHWECQWFSLSLSFTAHQNFVINMFPLGWSCAQVEQESFSRLTALLTRGQCGNVVAHQLVRNVTHVDVNSIIVFFSDTFCCCLLEQQYHSINACWLTFRFVFDMTSVWLKSKTSSNRNNMNSIEKWGDIRKYRQNICYADFRMLHKRSIV